MKILFSLSTILLSTNCLFAQIDQQAKSTTNCQLSTTNCYNLAESLNCNLMMTPEELKELEEGAKKVEEAVTESSIKKEKTLPSTEELSSATLVSINHNAPENHFPNSSITPSSAILATSTLTVQIPSQQTIQLNRTIDAQSDHFIQSAPPQEVGSERLISKLTLDEAYEADLLKRAFAQGFSSRSELKERMALLAAQDGNGRLFHMTQVQRNVDILESSLEIETKVFKKIYQAANKQLNEALTLTKEVALKNDHLKERYEGAQNYVKAASAQYTSITDWRSSNVDYDRQIQAARTHLDNMVSNQERQKHDFESSHQQAEKLKTECQEIQRQFAAMLAKQIIKIQQINRELNAAKEELIVTKSGTPLTKALERCDSAQKQLNEIHQVGEEMYQEGLEEFKNASYDSALLAAAVLRYEELCQSLPSQSPLATWPFAASMTLKTDAQQELASVPPNFQQIQQLIPSDPQEQRIFSERFQEDAAQATTRFQIIKDQLTENLTQFIIDWLDAKEKLEEAQAELKAAKEASKK
ncbi:MAG TPA: hypothetical protein VJK54_08815 [Chthoniobacterales bacterium]|nr:hypothetical protein [Chthoniobacterales bacterium]